MTLLGLQMKMPEFDSGKKRGKWAKFQWCNALAMALRLCKRLVVDRAQDTQGTGWSPQDPVQSKAGQGAWDAWAGSLGPDSATAGRCQSFRLCPAAVS